MKGEDIVIGSKKQKKITKKEYLAANQRLAILLNDKKFDYFDYLNLGSNTNLYCLKLGFINKLSIALHDNLSSEMLRDINTIIKAYVTLKNPVTAEKYIKKLEKSHQEIIEALNEFMAIRIAYAKSNHHNNVNIGQFSYISQNYVDWLERQYKNTTYKIDYSVDFNFFENFNFDRILGEIKDALKVKYENYSKEYGESASLKRRYKSTAQRLVANQN